jgi:hypothetical protein
MDDLLQTLGLSRNNAPEDNAVCFALYPANCAGATGARHQIDPFSAPRLHGDTGSRETILIVFDNPLSCCGTAFTLHAARHQW